MSEYLSFDFLSGSQPLANIDYYTKQQPQQQPQQSQSIDFDPIFYYTEPFIPQDPQEFDDEIEEIRAQGASLDTAPPPAVDNSELFASIRTGTPGVPSTFTLSSDSASAYGSGYNEADSVYTYHSQQSDLSAFYEQLNMNFPTLGIVDSDNSVYSAPSPISPQGSPNSSIGMNVASYSPSSFSHRGSFSDYEPTRLRVPPSSTSDYYPHAPIQVKYSSPMMQATVSPANVSTQLPSAQSMQSAVVASQQRQEKQDINLSRAPTTKDSKRKYQCPNCPRAFARAFNLKTHIQTHDPNRSKPYACHHKSCGRAFSRKHDLTRHLISIHRSDAETVGIATGARTRCQDCGASWASNGKKGCECDNVK